MYNFLVAGALEIKCYTFFPCSSKLVFVIIYFNFFILSIIEISVKKSCKKTYIKIKIKINVFPSNDMFSQFFTYLNFII